MCLLFLYVCDTAADDGYRLILADNRDEFWDRPTNLAEFWGPKGEILSGVDMEPGREGGTWLGVSRDGKIGVLLNILEILQPNKRGRGSLITDYLTEGLTNDQYVTQKILPIHQEYNKFNLILVDLRFSLSTYRSNSTPLTYYNNKTNTARDLPNGVYSYDNSTVDEPWQKSVHGQAAFTKAVQDHGRKTDKDQLIQSLLDILCDNTRFPDDKQLLKQASMSNTPDDIRLERSAAFVWSPSIRYGTRTNTIVLVDKFGECEYIERTFKIPVDPENLDSQTKSYRFQMQSGNKL
ncbi:transport and Golgi organization 2 homolog isoform X1 [Pecten maximus]|uniref:transport and Golgi organization 2 homolog isoform X1 n=1 Tax=Pecten maximus TaxID=6579 RepID=UPI001458B012|nr:transport and Golgi organization 2 homolog isoform X1 [Pecten maximus]XP_033748313.1 transport and Golgi organization 2 homolog isoform X1 [Pecten maximus]